MWKLKLNKICQITQYRNLIKCVNIFNCFTICMCSEWEMISVESWWTCAFWDNIFLDGIQNVSLHFDVVFSCVKASTYARFAIACECVLRCLCMRRGINDPFLYKCWLRKRQNIWYYTSKTSVVSIRSVSFAPTRPDK